ncbi:D-sedoheptulose 7-phosphate isomerase [Desulfocurvibacter africanus]|uniref:Phosphoheptose isomerase n=1 Tax=Desulfocurvibacter africanus subsp. africanus str. Walvis Bay TaxID=690850 RepID=F3YUL9_DESAF|nr:D-sedoheptulose 7-phosphate isomerase [Desulfocurvibacter africanus]EGJ48973.1 Phosphoheptose isomerase [Desulfocurvibacter africanus subsp. africanus str. Walvis Bay]
MSQEAIDRVLAHSQAGCRLRETFFQAKATLVADIARAMAVSLARGGKILLCGNGGSAADCQHIAAEFVNRFKLERPPLPALALTTDSSILTAIGNDYGFEQVFLKQVQALGRPGDVLVAISTSGGSPNVLAALRAAKEREIVTVGFTGASGGAMLPLCDYPVLVPEKITALIQEIHIAVGHLLCELVDYYLFEAVSELTPYLNEA